MTRVAIDYWDSYAPQVYGYASARPYDCNTDTRQDWPFDIDREDGLIAHLDIAAVINGEPPRWQLIHVDLHAGADAARLVVAAKAQAARTDLFTLHTPEATHAPEPGPEQPAAAVRGTGRLDGDADLRAVDRGDGTHGINERERAVLAGPPSPSADQHDGGLTNAPEPGPEQPAAVVRGTVGLADGADGRSIRDGQLGDGRGGLRDETRAPSPSPADQHDATPGLTPDDEGDRLDRSDFARLEAEFRKHQEAKGQPYEWLKRLTTEAMHANRSFHAKDNWTQRRHGILSGLLNLAANDGMEDETVRALVSLATGSDEWPHFPALTAGAVVGAMNATEAERFAALSRTFITGGMAGHIDDAGRFVLTLGQAA